MELTEDQIQRLKSLVRVAMTMNDSDKWKNGEYFGDARDFWEGAEIGIDTWVEKMRESQNASTSDDALHIADVGKQRELLIAFAEKYAEKRRQIGDNCKNADWFVDDFLKGNL